MNKRWLLIAGVGLVLLGGLALSSTILFRLFGVDVWGWWAPWRFWPILVWGLGIFLVGTPLLMWVRGRRKPGLGGMFLPGFPILTTGSLLLAASVFDAWELWAWAWPLEIIALAVGFLAFALYAKVIWLWLPAIVIGANGLLFQFCALTGWWEVWAVMWTIEPLSLGIAFLVVNVKQRSKGLLISGLILCSIGALGFMMMMLLVPLGRFWPGHWLFSLMWPLFLIIAGAGLLAWSLRHRAITSEGVEAA